MALSSSLEAIGFGILASLSWGTSDFSGGVAAKRSHIFGVMIFSYAVGLTLLIGLALGSGESFPSWADLVWAAAGGISGALGLAAYYRALAVGQMGITAPVSAVLGAMIPVLFSAFSEGLPGAAQVIGFGLAVIGVWFLSRPTGSGTPHQGLGLAVAAGLGFGLFFILINQVSEDAVFWPLVSARGMSLIVWLGVAFASHQDWHPVRAALPVILVAGLLDVGGNTFFLLSSQVGRLDVASVLSSLYPAITVLLAWVILHERLSRSQWIGVITALAAIPLIAA